GLRGRHQLCVHADDPGARGDLSRLARAGSQMVVDCGGKPDLRAGLGSATHIGVWRDRRRVWPVLLAATVPISLIASGLMLYNARRFDNPFEFGIHYQLLADQR